VRAGGLTGLQKWAVWVLLVPYVLILALVKPLSPPWIVCFVAFPVLLAVGGLWSTYRRMPRGQRLLEIGIVVAGAVGGLLWVIVTGAGSTTICPGSLIPQPPGVRLGVPCHAQLDRSWLVVGLVIGVAAGLVVAATVTGFRHLRPPS